MLLQPRQRNLKICLGNSSWYYIVADAGRHAPHGASLAEQPRWSAQPKCCTIRLRLTTPYHQVAADVHGLATHDANLATQPRPCRTKDMPARP